MGDQLSLELEPTLPAAPGTLRPMLARPAGTPFDSSSHLFEPSWGGRRALAFLEPAVEEVPSGGYLTTAGLPSVRLIDEQGTDLVSKLPEMGGLALRIEARSAVLDGELVIVDRAGRADSAGLARRLAGNAGPNVAYLAFDLLYLEGRPLLGEPLSRRRERLHRVLRPGPDIVAVPAIAEEGRALFDAAVGQGLAGVMARVRTSPYLPGIRSRLWRFVAASAVRDVAVAKDTGTPPGGSQSGGRAADGSSTGDQVDEPANAPVLALIQRLPLEDD
jgi:bifunctional non-homologous end joining protein LigD